MVNMIRLKDILSEQNPDPFGLRDLFNINKSSGAFKKLAKDLERKRNKRKSDSDSDKADSSLNVLFKTSLFKLFNLNAFCESLNLSNNITVS